MLAGRTYHKIFWSLDVTGTFPIEKHCNQIKFMSVGLGAVVVAAAAAPRSCVPAEPATVLDFAAERERGLVAVLYFDFAATDVPHFACLRSSAKDSGFVEVLCPLILRPLQQCFGATVQGSGFPVAAAAAAAVVPIDVVGTLRPVAVDIVVAAVHSLLRSLQS
ncbi:hypothetical protein BDZ91DRAFT_120168 [Kalaharituber pfeilii]|nr:hypothetical protein BDZ91DRAFT_120168 [Kalaharituber pfeilii]